MRSTMSILVCAVGVMCAAGSAHTAHGEVRSPFDNPAFIVGTNPTSPEIVDVNGDGFWDLVTVNASDGTVTALLGDGTGLFLTRVDSPIGALPRALAVADLNGDLIVDVAMAMQAGNEVRVMLGVGDGSFGTAQAFPANNTPFGIVIGDFNEDTRPDIAVPNRSAVSNSVSVLFGAGDGTFGAPTPFAVGSLPSAVAAGYLNNDAHLDIVSVNQTSNNVTVLLGSGAGTFPTRQDFSVSATPSRAVIGDLDQDGDNDLAITGTSGLINVLYNNGAGGFPNRQDIPTGVASPGGLAIKDMDKDGRADIVHGLHRDGGNYLGIYRGATMSPFSVRDEYAVLTAAGTPVIEDVNGDGEWDVVGDSRRLRPHRRRPRYRKRRVQKPHQDCHHG